MGEIAVRFVVLKMSYKLELDAAWNGRCYEWKFGTVKHKSIVARVVRVGAATKGRDWFWVVHRPFTQMQVKISEAVYREPEVARGELEDWLEKNMPQYEELWEHELQRAFVIACKREGNNW